MNRGHLVRRLLLVLSLLFSGAVLGAAQTTQLTQGPGRLVKHHYRNSGGEKGLSTIFYDHNGLPTRARWELLDGSRSSENYNTLDRAGHVIRKYREFSDGATSNVNYEFDDAGHLVSEDFSRSDGGSGSEDYEYDARMRLSRGVLKDFDSWLTGTITYEHDAEGRVKTGKFKGKEFNADLTFERDAYGNTTSIHWAFDFGKTQTYSMKYEKIAPEPAEEAAAGKD